MSNPSLRFALEAIHTLTKETSPQEWSGYEAGMLSLLCELYDLDTQGLVQLAKHTIDGTIEPEAAYRAIRAVRRAYDNA